MASVAVICDRGEYSFWRTGHSFGDRVILIEQQPELRRVRACPSGAYWAIYHKQERERKSGLNHSMAGVHGSILGTAVRSLEIVVPDPDDSKRFRHVDTYWVEHDGKVIKFAVDYLECRVWRFFVPAASTEEGAFEVGIARYEGFWRSSSHADENLPWPQRDAKWPQRAAFLEALDRAEAEAQRVLYRGFSRCRVCGCINGSQSFRLDVWEWPSGFRHYVADHEVRPSPQFELFVREWVQRAARLTV